MSLAEQRLSSISTSWTLLRDAHLGSADDAQAARELLWLRYGGAVRRYVAAAVADPQDAEDLAQEFAVALVRGDFHRPEPARGRFRDYVKTVLFRMVSDYRRRSGRQQRPVESASALESVPAPQPAADELFQQQWRDELLARAWSALADVHPDQHLVLRFRAEHSELRSAAIAAELTRQLGRPLTADNVRQMLRRARQQFAELLLEEVAHSLETATPEALAAELSELDLRHYCEDAFDRRAQRRP